MKNRSQIVAGLGEIGTPLYKLLSKSELVLGYDINPKLMKKEINFNKIDVTVLHICIPFTSNFLDRVNSLYKKFHPELIVIHSTVSPYTTQKLQQKIKIPIVYSATRGIHKRMVSDMKKYTKYFAIEKNAPKKKWATKTFSTILKKCGVKTKRMSDPITLELAKILVDTSYYGWLINYAQLSNMIAKKHNVDYDEMWGFSDEIHRFLGNRPKMFPGFIGGHCVIPNLKLIDNPILKMIEETNNKYIQKFPNAKLIHKKYDKSKKKSYSVD